MKNSMQKNDLKKISEISKIIKQSKTFFIAGHVKPDGDSIGSALALKSVLTRIGKKAEVYSSDDVPVYLKFLKGANKIKKSAKKNAVFDCAVILESVNFSRMGDIITPDQAKKIINIDHHALFTNFGAVNYIVPDSSSTAELIFNIAEYMKIKLTKDEAECLYTGILTDTGRFQQLNTTADSHVTAAKLIGSGVSPSYVRNQVYENNSLASVRLLGMALSSMHTACGGKMAYMVLTPDMFRKSGANGDETESVINFTMTVAGVKAGCLFKVIDKNTTKISFRSVKGFDVLKIARKYGGGGHKNAAGCTIDSNFRVSLEKIKKAFSGQMNA
ncbi:MAG: bifunctional oligoribonuclease/PAP phosphatase NrnA [Endomicrobium sp.]|jgi:phosphoesterase RecJ-like protein|nr:bifunctional oligoribonuclease/PAP phosphatase NrnA [Endomicrobium sp.]